MSTVIGDLAVRVGADTTGLVKGLSDSQKRLEEFGSKTRAGATHLAKYGAAATAAGLAISTALVKNSIAGARETANLAKIAGTTSGQFTKLAFAAQSVGVQQDKFSDILKDTNDRIGDFLTTGGGPMADFFENIAPKVGLTADQFRNLSGPQALQLYVDGLQKANVSQAEMTFFMEALASDATALLPLLKDGGAAMGEQAAQAERLGLALSSIQVEQMNEAGIAMERAASTLSGFADHFTAELSPVLTALSTEFLRAAENAGGVGEMASKSFGYAVDAAAFLMDMVEGVKRTFELAGKSIALFGLGVVDVMLTAANAIVNKPIQALNELIAALNQFAGTDFEAIGLSEMGESIANELRTVRNAQAIAMEDIRETMLRPMPSGQFKDFVAEAVAASEAVAAEAVKIQEAVILGAGTEQGGGGSNAKDREGIQAKLDRIREANMSEMELLREKFAKENAVINEAREGQLITQQEWEALMRDQKIRHEEEMTRIEKDASQARQRVQEQEMRAKQATMGQILGNMTTLMNTESRKMFEIGKMAGIANSIISTYTGASKALELGWPLGPMAAAAITAKGFAQVSAIRSQSFGGGGGGSAGGSPTQSINDKTEQIDTLNVSLQGFDPNSLYTGQQVGGLLDALSEEAKDRGLNLLVQQ